MRSVLAFDKQTGLLVGRQHAADKSEANRYSHDYKCPNTSCRCTFHWRKAVHAKENTEHRPATFVKNKSSSHIPGCRYNFHAFAKEHRDVAFSDGDYLNLRVQFPLGSAPSDLRPWEKGMLTEAQIRAAHNNVDKKGFPRLDDLTKFIERHFGNLEDPVLDDLRLYYQGNQYHWDDLFVASDNYKKLVIKGSSNEEDKKAEPVIAILKPVQWGDRNTKGKRRIICEAQPARPVSRLVNVKPILVCRDDFMASCLQEVIECDGSVIVSGRPFIVSPQRGADIFVYLNIAKGSQFATVSNEYWRPELDKRHQQDLFERFDI